MLDIQSVPAGTVMVGQTVPDVVWRDAATQKDIHLSELRGKPVVFFFGSCTCGPFRVTAGTIENIYHKYKDRVSCFLVYASEAHPDLGQTPYTRNAQNREDRRRAAQDLMTQVNLTLPVLLDTMDNRMETVFHANPSRLFVLDADGRVAYMSGEMPASNMAMPVPAILDRLVAYKTGSSGARLHEAEH